MNLSASNEVSMIIQGTVEEWNSKFPHFKTLLSLTCIHTNALKFYYYLTSSKLPSNTETTKKFPAEKKTTEVLRMYSVT